jgi:threonine/homoserine/homoserine lactone efflux protein
VAERLEFRGSALRFGHSRKSAAAIVAGVALGDLTSMTLSMIGLGGLRGGA